MTKEKFLSDLDKQLRFLEKTERQKQLSFYEEMMEDYIEDGCSEEEAVERIGNPGIIANEILQDQEEAPARKMTLAAKAGIGILLILGFPLWGSLLLTAVLCILSAYLVLWCLPFTTGVFAVSLFAAAVVSVIGAFPMATVSLGVGVTQFGIGIAAAGVAGLSFLATVSMSVIFLKATKYLTMKLIALFRMKEV